MRDKLKWINEADHKRLIKIFNILKQNAVQTKQFKTPVIVYTHFEKIAREINKEIK